MVLLDIKDTKLEKLEKVHQLFQHVIDQRHKYGGKHVADFDFLNFKKVKADGHD